MDHETHFRALLIKLQDSLSDTDRSRLHFLFGSVIPRRIRDDSSMNGTLNLLESLFDTGKINDQDFDYLIQAFKEIDRHDIANRLQTHARKLRKDTGTEKSSLLQQIIDDIEEEEEDKYCSKESQQLQTQYEADIKNNNFPPLLSSSKLPESRKNLSSVVDRSSYLNGTQRLTRWNHWKKILIVLVLIIILVAVLLLLLFILVRTQSKKVENRIGTTTEITPYPYQNKKKNSINHYLHTLNTDPVVIAYFTAWSIYIRKYFVFNIPVQKITHINYAFAKINSDGEIETGDFNADIAAIMPDDTLDQPLRGNFNQLIELKKTYSHLRTLITVGGYEGSERFSDVAKNAQNRSIFATSCVKFIEKYDFDGIDISWLYPVSGGVSTNVHRPEDKENYVLLLKELRQQLDAAANKKYLLTIHGGVGTYIDNMDLSSMINYLDWINVLTYDFHGAWESQTNHHAPLYRNPQEKSNDFNSKLNCDATIQAYMNGKVPTTKIVMSIPLYGRAWQGVKKSSRNGYLQSVSSATPKGTWSEPGVFDYDHLKRDFIPSYERRFDHGSKVPYLFNSSTGIWISYEDLESIGWKTKYIKNRRLRGACFWELSMDRQSELISATFEALINDKDLSSANH